MTSVFQTLQTAQSTVASAVDTTLSAPAMRVQPLGTAIERISFAKAIANGIDTDWGSVVMTGSGMTVNQTGGNLVITTGTTARSETIIRSNNTANGDIRFHQKTILSQRIANQNFIMEMVDVLGDNLAYTITSATSISVVIPNTTLTSANVGQSVTLCGFNGTGTFLSGRYAIASVTGTTVVFTVAGFAVGTGTLSAVGLNFYRCYYDGTTATNAKFDTGRSGYSSGDTTLTVNTTASPGHMTVLTAKDMVATIGDQLVASSAAAQLTIRGNRIENVPTDRNLYVQIRALNLGTAPASTTTWTIGMVSASALVAMDVALQDIRPMSPSAPIPFDLVRSITQTVSGTVVVSASTPATGTSYNLTTAATTNAGFIKASAGSLFVLTISNLTSATIYVKLFNKASAPTLGTDLPFDVIPVAAGVYLTLNYGEIGQRFATGLAIAVTANAVATDATAVTAGALIHGTYI